MSLILLYLATGVFAGLLAGLFGIGGGLIIVPLLLISFRIQGVHEAVSTHLAVGTSLASIVITGISSVRAHLREVDLNWPLVIQLTHGLTLEEAAKALGIRLNTARAHLRSIFSKTGVRRQTELVRIFLNSVAWLGNK